MNLSINPTNFESEACRRSSWTKSSLTSSNQITSLLCSLNNFRFSLDELQDFSRDFFNTVSSLKSSDFAANQEKMINIAQQFFANADQIALRNFKNQSIIQTLKQEIQDEMDLHLINHWFSLEPPIPMREWVKESKEFKQWDAKFPILLDPISEEGAPGACVFNGTTVLCLDHKSEGWTETEINNLLSILTPYQPVTHLCIQGNCWISLKNPELLKYYINPIKVVLKGSEENTFKIYGRLILESELLKSLWNTNAIHIKENTEYNNLLRLSQLTPFLERVDIKNRDFFLWAAEEYQMPLLKIRVNEFDLINQWHDQATRIPIEKEISTKIKEKISNGGLESYLNILNYNRVNLAYLDLTGSLLTAEQLKLIIFYQPFIKHLILGDFELNGTEGECLESLYYLEVLEINNCNDFIGWIPKNRLRKLIISNCQNLTDKIGIWLSQMRALKKIDIINSPKLTHRVGHFCKKPDIKITIS